MNIMWSTNILVDLIILTVEDHLANYYFINVVAFICFDLILFDIIRFYTICHMLVVCTTQRSICFLTFGFNFNMIFIKFECNFSM